MLAIRMQRTGRKGHAMFRIIVQDSRRTPTSGKVVAQLGSYDPHAKALILDKDKAAFYLEHGAQPSDRVARLLKSDGVALPSWVILPAAKTRTVRNADKRRSSRPPEPVAETPVAPAAQEVPVTETVPEVEVAEASEAPQTELAAEEATPDIAEKAEPTPEASPTEDTKTV